MRVNPCAPVWVFCKMVRYGPVSLPLASIVNNWSLLSELEGDGILTGGQGLLNGGFDIKTNLSCAVGAEGLDWVDEL